MAIGNNTALAYGTAGFIGAHLVKQLKRKEYWVCGVDLEYPLYKESRDVNYVIGDFCKQDLMQRVKDKNSDNEYIGIFSTWFRTLCIALDVKI